MDNKINKKVVSVLLSVAMATTLNLTKASSSSGADQRNGTTPEVKIFSGTSNGKGGFSLEPGYDPSKPIAMICTESRSGNVVQGHCTPFQNLSHTRKQPK
jgi:hypothetical protein